MCLALGCGKQQSNNEAEMQAKARELAHKFILVDTHIDVPYRLRRHFEDISKATSEGNFDLPRARKGGLDAAFMSIYIPSSYQGTPRARALADSLIDMMETLVREHPDQFALARSPEEVRANFQAGKFSIAMGMENGAPIETLEDVPYFYSRGIRYVTLTHAKDNHICDSSYDTTHTWNGLSPFGEKLVPALNRAGIMVDISHVSDS
ncbi:MAG: membrane dipeptidase, partial [Calditrichaeota bacterium]